MIVIYYLLLLLYNGVTFCVISPQSSPSDSFYLNKILIVLLYMIVLLYIIVKLVLLLHVPLCDIMCRIKNYVKHKKPVSHFFQIVPF